VARIKGQAPLTLNDKRDIAKRYINGETIRDLRTEYRRTRQTIKDVLLDAGVELRPPGYGKGKQWSPEHREAHKRATATPEFAEKSRQALLKRLPSMRGPATNTPIERRLHDALKAAGIGFTTQSCLLDRYLVDIELHQAPILIEADGAQHTLRDQKAKDAERDAALTAAGYRIFRFTGSEINRNAAECVHRVVEACDLTPDVNPVYEIRTRFAGPDHPRWSQVKFTCDQCGTEFSKPPSHRASEHAFCNQQCYGDWLREHPEVNSRRLQRDWTGLAELYDAGMSLKQLGVHFGCSNSAIRTAMRELGIKIRPTGGRRVPGGFYQAGESPGS
jgi:very-short-patch-repair endonuclease